MIVSLLSVVAVLATFLIVMRMSIDRSMKIRQMRRDHDYQMALLRNEHELLAITPRAKAQVEVLDAQTRAERVQIHAQVASQTPELVRVGANQVLVEKSNGTIRVRIHGPDSREITAAIISRL